MRVVICGAGIAGLTLAWCLERQGHEPLIVERAPRLRDDGYMLDFFGTGLDVAERLGLWPDLERLHDPVERLVFVDDRGRQRVCLPYAQMRSRLFRGRHFNFMRGALEGILYNKLRGRAGICFGTTVRSFTATKRAVEVTLSNGATISADLLVGADGVHSRIRRLTFGEDRAFLQPLGYTAAAYIIAAPPPALRLDRSVFTLTAPGRQLTLYPIDGDRTATFFAYRNDDSSRGQGLDPCEELSRVYHGLGWLVLEALTRCPAARDIYLDDVVQVDMSAWHRGRVVLVGDACQCLSPFAGQGAAMAMTGAYVLAQELERAPSTPLEALASYEHRLRSLIVAQQRSARRLARWVVPRHPWQVMARDVLARVALWPLASSLLRPGASPGKLRLA